MTEHVPLQRHRLPDLHSYDVTGDELDRIDQEAMEVGLDFAFASIAFTAFISFAIVLATVPKLSDRTFLTFFSVMLTSGGFTVYCGIKWWRGRKHGQTVIQRIRQREVGPLGDEGKQIKATELGQLPAQAPPAGPGT